MPLKLKTKEEIIKLVDEADSETIEEIGSKELGCFFDGEQDDETYWIHPETKEHLTAEWFWDERKNNGLTFDQAQKLQKQCELVTCESDKEFDRIKEVDWGNDGDGRDMWAVLHIPEYELYIKLNGTYSSWGNSEWDSMEIVQRKKKTIYVYE